MLERLVGQQLAFCIDQQVETEKCNRSLTREASNAALCRMNALEQRVEIKMAAAEDHNLAIEHELLLWELLQRLDQFGKVAAERLSGLGLQHNLVVFAECESAESVPFGFVEPISRFGNTGRVARF